MLLAACLWLAPVAVSQAPSQPKNNAPKEESRPNFSGTWVMNPEKSDWAEMKPPDTMRYVIRHTGGSLTLISTQDSVTKRLEITTDGQERMTEEDAESEILARVYWDGKTLVWQGRRRAKPAHQIDPLSWTSHWSLSEDGKTLTVKRQITVVQGTLDQTIEFDRK